MNRNQIVIAVDGGGSKTDAVALDVNGAIRASARSAGSSPQIIGVEASANIVMKLVTELVTECGGASITQANVYLSGLDLDEEITIFRNALMAQSWAVSSGNVVIDNDMFALLRSGTLESNAVAVVCGTGINCLGVSADGRTARFAALGSISGDWGGGAFLGGQALWHAARAVDGRGVHTVLASAIPEHFGLPDIPSVIEAIHFGRIPGDRIAGLTPLLLNASAGGDPVAGGIIDRQAEEIAIIAVAAITRLGLTDVELPIVLGGGVLAAADTRLLSSIRKELDARAPRARIQLVMEPPILGAALLALESIGADANTTASAAYLLSQKYTPTERVNS